MAEFKTSLEVIAPTVEEAVKRGTAQLGVPREALDIHVLDEGSRGVFGLTSRQARVRLVVRGQTLPGAGQTPEPELVVRGQAPPALAPTAQPESSEEDHEAVSTARVVVESLLERMEIDAAVDAVWGEPSDEKDRRPLLVNIRGGDLSLLIGRKGETLAALQYITRLIVAKETQRPVAVVVDVQGYRARREEQLRQLAKRMAEQAVERGRTMILEPMPANERRIIHLELRDHPQVTTESTGEADQRKVTIIPRL
ncbi:MAG: Jag N-terminal domain-containing protein [Anaerolineales bacterium]|nr:Jag N-terminal domain-containing protein [Anaerolineales bacterium]